MKHTRDGGGDRNRFLEIEFIGGPYDGHKELCFTRPIDLCADLVWFVCEDVFRLLDGKDSRPGASITSVALYELDEVNGACRYQFVGAVSVKDLAHSMCET